MGRVGAKIKRAGQSLWYGDKYLQFEATERKASEKPDKPRIPLTSDNDPIQELGVMVGGTGLALTGIGAAAELSQMVSNEIAHMSLLSGLGGVAIGGLIYAYGKIGQ